MEKRPGHGAALLAAALHDAQQRRTAPAQASFFADPFGSSQPSAPAPRPASSGGGAAFCVRSCDGKYFALQIRSGTTHAQMCQAFCPAGNAKVYYGSQIDGASWLSQVTCPS